jgi:CheY-like chemotaxis protein
VARVHLVHWDPEDAAVRLRALRTAGYTVDYLPGVTGTPLMRALRSGQPDLFLIDLSRLPSHGREVAMALRTSPATRTIPIVFVAGDPDKVARLRELLPDAAYTTWGRVRTALTRARRAPPAAPVVPPDRLYAGRTLAQKLGIAAGERVAVIGAPAGFDTTLGALPARVRLTAAIDLTCERFVWFLRRRAELHTALARLGAGLGGQVVWLAWPKKASGVSTDLDGNVVRDAGLAAGLVDFKVCSVDQTGSGLAFKRARRGAGRSGGG